MDRNILYNTFDRKYIEMNRAVANWYLGSYTYMVHLNTNQKKLFSYTHVLHGILSFIPKKLDHGIRRTKSKQDFYSCFLSISTQYMANKQDFIADRLMFSR